MEKRARGRAAEERRSQDHTGGAPEVCCRWFCSADLSQPEEPAPPALRERRLPVEWESIIIAETGASPRLPLEQQRI